MDKGTDSKAFTNQQLQQMAANEPSRAGDENLFRRHLPFFSYSRLLCNQAR